MIPSSTGIKRSSTFAGQSIEMSIDTNSLAHIMSVLTNLYSDPEMAVLREYSCNARDSHLAVGQTRPIEVTLPTMFDQYLVIEDFGLGLSIDDITDIYSRYGASTKRGTNEQTGMLGLGSKSALTYATQFTMTAVKDGVRSEVLISVKVDGSGKMEVMDTVATDEPNGVRITIPTSPQNNFAENAKSLFQYWEAGTVLVNGEQPETLADTMEMTDIGDGMFITDKQRYWGNRDVLDIVVMGGVPYPVPKEYRDKLAKVSNRYCVFYVPMGDVDFVPSREEMNLTPRTKQYLSDLIDTFTQNVGKAVAKEINGCTTHNEALRVATKWRSVGNFERNQKFTFRGQEIPSQFQGTHYLYDGTYKYGSRKQSKQHFTSADFVGKSVFVYGYTPESLPSKTIREKVWKWLENNGHKKREIILYSPTDFIGAWSTAIKVDYADIKATKLPSSKTPITAGKTRVYDWDIVQPDGKVVEGNVKSDAKVAYYTITATNNEMYRFDVRKRLYEIATQYGYTLVEASAGRHSRLAREIPDSTPMLDVVKAHLDSKVGALSSRDRKLFLYTSSGDIGSIRLLTHGIKDQRLIAEIDDIKKSTEAVDVVWRRVKSDARIFGDYLRAESVLASDYKLSLHEYPLLATLPRFTQDVVDELVIYLNAKYESNN